MSEEGLVREILSDGTLSTEEIKKELKKKDICFVQSYDRTFSGLFVLLATLWLLPTIAQWTGWGFLRFFAQLPSVGFSIGVILGATVLFVAAVALEAKLVSMRRKQGGCQDAHETVFIVRDGPYGVVRHPGYLAEMVYFGVLPIVLSERVPFTILAALCIAVAMALFVYLIRVEDRFNLKKWGKEYRQYMAEVPAVNFVKGLLQSARIG
jgi:protein-S-isoprenylcysteine O-methyltransferase Ste14